MAYVKAKKYLGQHFLKDEAIAKRIVDSLVADNLSQVLEIGPGMGVLTKFLIKKEQFETYVVEIDDESIAYLITNLSEIKERIIREDFLKLSLPKYFDSPLAIIGNFPYNISSQILFKMIENKDMIPELVGMFQKEVAERISSKEGSKTYGILSVLLQAYYSVEYLFTVDEHVFAPPPKVKSAVVRIVRNDVKELACDEKLLFKVVKTAFNQRRKMLRNSLKVAFPDMKINQYFEKRPEQLSVPEFIDLTLILQNEALLDT